MRPDELGRGVRDLVGTQVVRLYRGDRAFGIWDREAEAIQPGDMVIEVIQRAT